MITEAMLTAALMASAPATHVQADGMVRDALAESAQVWVGWGWPAEPLKLRVYDEPAGSPGVARAHVPGDTVYIDRDYRDDVWDRANDRHTVTSARVAALGLLCGVMAHERGHTLGIGHEPEGIMRSVAQAPGRCFTWATRWIKQMRRNAARMGA